MHRVWLCAACEHIILESCVHFMSLQIAGPMWSGPLHNDNFLSKVLEHLENNQGKYGTAVRMRGMLTVAKEVRDLKLLSCRSQLISDLVGAARPVLLHTIPDRGFLPLDLPPF